jgi:hypothetical protein
MMGSQPTTRKVTLLRPTMIAGKREEVGSTHTLSYSVASDLIHSKKAEPFEEGPAKPEPAKPEPAKSFAQNTPAKEK